MKYLAYVFVILLIACQNEPKEASASTDETTTESSTETTTETEEKKVVENDQPRVTGIGGIFFQMQDPLRARSWYGKNLGIAIDNFGSVFETRNANNPDEVNYLRWSPMTDTADYFKPSKYPFMINYRVHNLEGIIERLKTNNVTILDSIIEYPFGKFLHILGPEGEKIELWEPKDAELAKLGSPTTK
jgi:predicted enzyme related to lactoylglutathione lyase